MNSFDMLVRCTQHQQGNPPADAMSETLAGQWDMSAPTVAPTDPGYPGAYALGPDVVRA